MLKLHQSLYYRRTIEKENIHIYIYVYIYIHVFILAFFVCDHLGTRHALPLMPLHGAPKRPPA